MKRTHIFKTVTILFLVTGILGCKKLYTPDISAEYTALVVEGLVSNTSGQYSVKLSTSVPFDSIFTSSAVKGASVYVQDNDQTIYNFYESGAGVYLSDGSWTGIPGKSYVLHIKTSDGNLFESTEQELPQAQAFDSIHGFNTVKVVLTENSYGESYKTYIKGMDVLLDLNKDGTGPLPLCRFKSTLLLESIYAETTPAPFSMPKTFYFWNTFSLDNQEVLSGTKFSSNSTALPNQSLCFIPTTKSAYTIGDTQTIYRYLLTVQQYNVNNETYAYYKNVNDQLSSGGKLFDPIASQLNGNIKCTNNSQKIVLGLFEASSFSMVTYKVMQPGAGGSNILFNKINNLGYHPGSGVAIDVPPDFWVY